ncbi:MAG: permease [Desulfobacteraceae bacterium]|nr:permease [Desulfobacteraceae bacterium]
MIKLPHLAFGYLITLVFAVVLLGLHIGGFPVGYRLLEEFTAFSSRLLIFIPCLFVLIGLLDVWLPQQWIQKHVGEESGGRGVFFVVLLAMFQGGPLYGAFPVAHLLRKKGCSMRNVFMYLGAFSTLKIPMMFFEVSFLGLRFTLIRAMLALPVFIIIADLMSVYARRNGLQMKNPGESP